MLLNPADRPRASTAAQHTGVCLAVIVAGLLGSCGGGEAPQEQLALASARPIASPSSSSTAQQVAAAARVPQAAAAQGLTRDVFFDWAANRWPQFFPGTYVPGVYLTYEYRYYPATGNFMAVSQGDVYVLPSGGPLIRVAPLSDFTCSVLPNLCAVDPRSAIADVLAQVRTAGGFGTLQVNGSLQASAQAHADYVLVNYFVGGVADPLMSTLQPDGTPTAHYEFVGRPGYTGSRYVDRAIAAGYASSSSVGEVLTAIYGTKPGVDPDATACLSALMNTVYHRSILLSTQLKDIGVGISASVSDTNGYRLRTCVLDLGGVIEPNPMTLTWSGVFPFPGQSGVPPVMGLESPDPAPSIKTKGAPVYVQVPTDMVLTATSFVLSDQRGMVVPSVVLTHASDSRIGVNESFLLPVVALETNVMYNVRFSGTAQGRGQLVPTERAWSFTTGS